MSTSVKAAPPAPTWHRCSPYGEGADKSLLVLGTMDLSNVGGVGGGTTLVDDPPVAPDTYPDTVTTGMEIAIPLAAIGNPIDQFDVCAYLGNSDFVTHVQPGPAAHRWRR